MPVQQLPAVVATSSYWFVGNIPTSGTRIQDVLMDPSTDSTQLTDVRVCSFAGAKCLNTLPQMVIPKGQIELLLIPSSLHEAPLQRLYKYTQKRSYQAFVVVGGYCVDGAISLPSAPKDPAHTLSHQMDRFFPITQASISQAGGEPFDSPILLANKEYVTCFHIGEEIATDPPTEETPPSTKSQQSGFEAESLSLLEGLGLFGGASAPEHDYQQS